MKKIGFLFFILVLFFPFIVNAHAWNKGVSNPYDLASYSIRDRNGGTNNNTIILNSYSTDDSNMYTLNFNATHKFNITSDITCTSDPNDNLLDIADCSAISLDETDLDYWIVPICVNKYDFSVSMASGNCPACFEKSNNVSILIGDENSCTFVNPDFVGPVQYLSDPFKGTTAYLTFKVKQYRVPNTLLSATANDTFTIYNNRSDYPLIYRFLNTNDKDGGLYDKNGINSLSLRTNSPDIATIQNDNVNAPYDCKYSYNRLDVSQGSYFNNDVLTLSTNTLPLIRNIDDSNLLELSTYYARNSSVTLTSTGFNAVNTSNYPSRVTFPISVVNGKSYTVSFDYALNSGTLNNFFVRFASGQDGGTWVSPSSPSLSPGHITFTFTANNTGVIYLWVYFNSLQSLVSYNVSITNLMVNEGNEKSYVPYNVYGFNNNISNYNYSSFQFVETNLVQKGKVQYCVKYKDNWTNLYNIECSDFIVGSESSFLGMNSHMHYKIGASIYNTCLYGFGYLCGDKLPQSIQFQLIDTNGMYTFSKPLLYSKNVSYNKITGKTEFSIDGDNSIPNYVPPNRIVCTDKNNGNIYDYNSRKVIYDSSDSNDTFADTVYLQNEYNNLFGGYEIPDKFGLSGLIDIPVTFVNEVRSGTCSNIDLSFKIKNNNVTAISLPCGSTFWNRPDIVAFKPFIETFFTGLVVYQILFNLLFFVRSKRDPIKITNDDGSEELMVL